MAEGDKDRPQVTQSSDSDEPSSISPLDIRSVSPLATGKGPLGLSEPPKGPPDDPSRHGYKSGEPARVSVKRARTTRGGIGRPRERMLS